MHIVTKLEAIKSLAVRDYLKKLVCIYIMEYYAVVKRGRGRGRKTVMC